MTRRPSHRDDSFLWRLEQFARFLLEAEPETVLDVGCGWGELLRRLEREGVAAAGVERDRGKVEHCQTSGLQVRAGSATGLPFPDRSFHWVSLRHVLHHLEDVSAALAEGLRIASVGLLVAEPWFDGALRSHALAREIDTWSKALHRSHGYVHHPGLTAEQIVGALPDVPVEVESRIVLQHVESDAREKLEAACASLKPPQGAHDIAEALERLREVTQNGTRVMEKGSLMIRVTHVRA